MPANGQPTAKPEPNDADSQHSGETDQPVPMNRAERRAKGKAKQQQHLSVGKIDPHRAGGAHTHRQYSNRRSGG